MQKRLRYHNRSISYWIVGSGQPVMLAHGFAEDHQVWIHQQKFLEKKFKLILPDLPGSGESDQLSETSMESMAEVLAAILDEESIDQLAMIGHSMGGYVTLAFAKKYGSRLNSFCLFHSTAYPDSDEKKQARLKSIEFIKKNGVEEFLKASTPNLFAKDPEGNLKQQMILELIDEYRDMKAEALIAYYEAMMKRPDRTDVLKTFTKPILYLLGKEDTAVPYSQGMEQTKLARNIEVHTLAQSGHMGMWEETNDSNGIIDAFLKNNVG